MHHGTSFYYNNNKWFFISVWQNIIIFNAYSRENGFYNGNRMEIMVPIFFIEYNRFHDSMSIAELTE